MKFDKFIRKTYTLLEKDEQQGAAQPPQQGNNGEQNSSKASSEIEKVGKKMGDQVERAEEELYRMSKDLIDVILQALQADNINLNDHPNLKGVMDKIIDASDSADAKTGLPEIASSVEDATEDIKKKAQPFNI